MLGLGQSLTGRLRLATTPFRRSAQSPARRVGRASSAEIKSRHPHDGVATAAQRPGNPVLITRRDLGCFTESLSGVYSRVLTQLSAMRVSVVRGVIGHASTFRPA